MRRRILMILAVLFLLALTTPARADGDERRSPERTDAQSRVQPDSVPLPELPAAEVFAADGEMYGQVTSNQMMQAVAAVNSGDAVRITVTAPDAGEAASAGVTIPGDALAAVAERTEAELSLVSGFGQITLSAAAVSSIAEQTGGEDVTFTMAQEAPGANPTVSIQSGGRSIADWDGESAISPVPVSRPMVLSPLAAQAEASGPAVRPYAAYVCLAAAVLLSGGCVLDGIVTKYRGKSEK